MPIKKVKLNCAPVCTMRPPVKVIPVPSSHMEAIGRSIKKKHEERVKREIGGMEKAKRLIVR